MQKIIYKLRFGLRILKEYSTWILAFKDYFGLIRQKRLKIHVMRNGAKYYFRPKTEDFGIINEIYVVKEYDFLIKHIKEKSTIIDIGAQMGVFSIYAGLLKKSGKIYSYEPFKPNYDLLIKNIELNHLKNKIFAFQLGIGKNEEERDFILCPINTGGHGFYCTDGGKKIKIKTISLKKVFEENKIRECDFLKMDCEGAEYEILYNTPKKYLDRIKSMSVEYHKNGDVNKLKKYLEKNGFKITITHLGEGMLYAEKNGI